MSYPQRSFREALSRATGRGPGAALKCKAKARFKSYKEAAKYYIGSDGFRLYPYRCTICSWWHVSKHQFGK